MDFDDLDNLQNPPRAPSRTTRFAPKSSKAALKPPKSEPHVLAPKMELSGGHSDSTEELPEWKPSISGAAAPKNEASASNSSAVEMELDHKPVAGEAEPMEEDESSLDQVVREIEVFFNPSIDANTQLYLLQYPLRPWWRPYELDEQCKEVRVKPISAEVEIDLTIDVDSKEFDSERNSQYKMEKEVLSTSWKPPRATSYAVGLLSGNKLHLNPIHSVVQLRPSMQHLYPEVLKMKKIVTGNPERNGKTGDEEKAGSSKKQGKQVESHVKQENDEEHWVPLVFHGARSDISAKYLQKMVAQKCSPIHFAMSPYDYVNAICRGASTQNNQLEGSSRRFYHYSYSKLLFQSIHIVPCFWWFMLVIVEVILFGTNVFKHS
ncbi:hypothetical protein SAY86_021765 [Trapa natans]|uniref:DNA-directed RNA polymerase III subunit RPC5 n=1 Tax=Trapa natans TaxID=22666 RepID=A0AAN7MZN3_TRANT|nr:hypothetical protein SAY86_021765 [Trapa natans]